MNALFGLGQALLQALDPERAHNLAIKSLELGLYPRAAGPDDKRLAQSIFGLDFANPLGMAAGFDKNARACRVELRHGLGFVEVGTLTPRAQSGNATPRIRSPADGAIINRLGFNNQGQSAALARLRHRPPGIVGINIGAGATAPITIADYVSGIERMGGGGKLLHRQYLFAQLPPGLRDLQAPEALDLLLKRVLSRAAAR